MLIAADDKKAMINTLQEKGYAAKDNYENLRENYILMGSIMKEVASISFFGNMFVMNPFVAIVAIILLYLLNIFVGLVPVYSTIRKTPAEILSRTDVD